MQKQAIDCLRLLLGCISITLHPFITLFIEKFNQIVNNRMDKLSEKPEEGVMTIFSCIIIIKTWQLEKQDGLAFPA